MKRTTFFTIALVMLATVTASAKVWTVNNYHGAANFTTLQDAINGATAGDTIYLEASATHYGAGTLAKKLVIIGAGYWLTENDTTQANKNVSRVTLLTFNAGSEGSVVSGLYIYYGDFTSTLNWKLIAINTDNVTLTRNFIKGYANSTSTSEGYTFYINGNRNGIRLHQNWIEAAIYDGDPYNQNGTVNCIYFSGIPANCLIQNNFIRGYLIGGAGGYRAIYLPTNSPQNDVRVLNNIIWGNVVTYYTELTNNIMLSGSYNNGLGDGTSHNLCNSTQFPAGNGNQQNVNMDNVFVDYDLYIDKGYPLKPSSPARNAGVNGGDCGVFSNDIGPSYLLSGIPPIPAIFEVNTQNYGEETIPVNIKAKSNN
jgi:hypothetical protein